MLVVTANNYSATAQTADDIIAKHIDAIGGEKNWNSIKSMKMIGTGSMQGQEYGFTQTIVDKKGVRQDISIAGQNGYIIITPKEAWSYYPFMGQTKPESLPMDQVKDQLDNIDVKNLNMASKEQFKKAEYAGIDTINKVSCYKIKLGGDDGATAYIDSKTYYLVRVEKKMKMQGEEQEMATDFSNFKKQDIGVVVPMTMTTQMGGDINFKTIEINKPVDEKVFTPDTK